MPNEGVFCRVVNGGELKAGSKLEHFAKVFTGRIITLSDRASSGVYEDRSGPAIISMLENYWKDLNIACKLESIIIPDDAGELKNSVEEAVSRNCDFIFTTGSTGISPRDIASGTLRPMFDKEIPGIMEMIRVKYGMENPNALLSNSLAGVIGGTLVYSIPGSVKGVKEYMTEILRTLRHSALMLHQIDAH